MPPLRAFPFQPRLIVPQAQNPYPKKSWSVNTESRGKPTESRGYYTESRGKSRVDGWGFVLRKPHRITLSILFFNPLGLS